MTTQPRSLKCGDYRSRRPRRLAPTCSRAMRMEMPLGLWLFFHGSAGSRQSNRASLNDHTHLIIRASVTGGQALGLSHFKALCVGRQNRGCSNSLSSCGTFSKLTRNLTVTLEGHLQHELVDSLHYTFSMTVIPAVSPNSPCSPVCDVTSQAAFEPLLTNGKCELRGLLLWA